MASSLKLSYQRLEKLPLEADEDHKLIKKNYLEDLMVVRRSRRFGGGNGGRQWWGWRRSKPRVRIAGLRRLCRRKGNLVAKALRVTMAKVVRRFKEGKPYIGDLFAGNYMFMQVDPSPTIGALKKSLPNYYYHHYNHHNIIIPTPTVRFNYI